MHSVVSSKNYHIGFYGPTTEEQAFFTFQFGHHVFKWKFGRKKKKANLDFFGAEKCFVLSISTDGTEAVHLRYGPDSWHTCDYSSTCFIPWNETRLVEHTFYDAKWTLSGQILDVPERIQYDSIRVKEFLATSFRIRFKENGIEKTAKIHFQKMVWFYGDKIWKYLCAFKKPIVNYRLEYQFETGVFRNLLIGSEFCEFGEDPIEVFKRISFKGELNQFTDITLEEIRNV